MFLVLICLTTLWCVMVLFWIHTIALQHCRWALVHDACVIHVYHWGGILIAKVSTELKLGPLIKRRGSSLFWCKISSISSSICLLCFRAPFQRESLTPTLSLSMRIISLFAFGVALALVLNFLQKQKNVTVFSPGVFGDVLNSAWWMPPAFGFGASMYLTSD